MSSPSSDRSSAPQFWQSIKTTLQQQRQAPPLQPVARDQSLPLSFAQERLWFLHQLYPDNLAYQTTAAYRLHTAFNLTALEQALIALQQRHEILRTTFPTINGKPIQAISTTANIQIPISDFSSTPPSDLKVAIQKALEQAAQKTFNLAEDLAWRVELLQLSETDAILLLSLHHIIYDAWSLGIFYREFTVLYNHFATGAPIDLPALPIQYADFAAWQRQWLQGEVLQSQIDYWQQQLDQIPVLQLPTDRPRPKLPTGKGAVETMHLSPMLTAQLKAIGQATEATLFMALLTVFKVLLYRYTQQIDLVVGTPIANRNRAELQGIMGFFTNTLVLRSTITGEMNFKACLEQVQSITLDAYAHQDLPFEKLVEVLQPERDLSRSPLFQVMLTLQNIPEPKRSPQGLIMGAIPAPEQTTKFDLNLFFQETNQGVTGLWEYSSDLFDAATIQRMQQHFLTLLASIVAEPDRPIGQLSLLTITEQYQLLVAWNQTRVPYPNGCLHQLFEAQAVATPDAMAAIFDSEEISYQSLNEKANQLAHYLQTLGVKPGEVVGLCIPRSIAMLVGLLGILKAGAAYLPLDPAYPIDRLEFMMTDARLGVLITHQEWLEQLPKLSLTTVCLDTVQEQLSTQPITNLSISVQPHYLSYVIYTSGSTGQPKGVAMPHRSIVNLIHWQTANSQVGVNDRTLQFTSLSFDVSVQEIFATWNTGGTLLLVTEDMRRDPLLLLNLLETQKIARLFLPFIALQQLAETAARNPTTLPDLREIITAGEQLRMTPALQTWLDCLPDCILQNQYGPSESHVVTAYTCDRTSKDMLLPPIGRPIANTEVYVLDKYLQPVPIGIPGELYIAGIGLAHGYLHHPELTIEKFIVNPFFYTIPSAYSKLYKTGDRVRYQPNGNLEFLGRIDHQVKIRGYRVEPEEIAAVLSQHPQVQEVVVLARDDQPGEKRLVAYIVPDQHQVPAPNDLRQVLKQKLPSYMIPVAFVPLDALPLTPNGKIDRQALPVPDQIQHTQTPFIAPRNEIEQQLAEIWAQILWKEQPIGIHDNFFDLGGHSLLSVRLVAEIEKVFHTRLPVAALFQLSTVAELAEYLTEQLQEETHRRQKTETFETTIKEETPTLTEVTENHLQLDPEIYHQLLAFTAGWQGQRVAPDSLIVGLNTEGSYPPLFWCLQGFQELSQLAKYLGTEQPIYGMRSGHLAMQYTASNIQAIAHHYVKEIHTVQSKGPYLLGGNCQAGIIVYEIARQLMGQGQVVTLLIILENIQPQFYPGRIAILFGQDSYLSPYQHFCYPKLGWQKLYPAGFSLTPISGAHGQFFQEPNIVSLTDAVRAAIAQAQTEGWNGYLPDIAYQAQLTLLSSLTTLQSGSSTALTVRIQNLSPIAWQMTERSGIVLGYRWLTELGQQLVSTPTSSDRSLLHQNVQPYEICDLNLTITAPNAVGNYQLEIDLVEEGITWFRAKGSKTIRVQVNITAITPQDELEKQRQLEAVISSYQQAMEAQGNCPDLYSELENLLAKAYFELGNVQCQLGQLDAATKNCQKAIAVDPQNFWAYWNLGDIAKAQGRWQEAVEYYKRATEIKPDYANAQVELENAQRLLAEHRK